MSRKNRFFPVFLFIIIGCVIVLYVGGFAFSQAGGAFVPLERILFHSSQKTAGDESVEKLKKENGQLRLQLAELKKIKTDNEALHDQFTIKDPAPRQLIAAEVVGAPGFIPGTSVPEYLVVNKGKKDGVKEGSTVVYKNALVGRVTAVRDSFAQVNLITSKSSSFAAKDQESSALGIIRGEGDDIFLDNVVLMDKLSVGDTIITKGDENIEGKGFAPGLVIGKIASVDKSQSALFQKATLSMLYDPLRLTTVFVMR